MRTTVISAPPDDYAAISSIVIALFVVVPPETAIYLGFRPGLVGRSLQEICIRPGAPASCRSVWVDYGRRNRC